MARLTSDWYKASFYRLELYTALKIFLQTIVFQQDLVVDIYNRAIPLWKPFIKELCKYTELMYVLIEQSADLRNESIYPVEVT